MNIKYIRLKDPIRKNQSDIFYIQDVLYSSWLGPSVWYILYSRCTVIFLIGSLSLIYFIFKMYCILPDWVLQSDIFYIQDVLYSSWLCPSVWYILYSRCIVFFLIGSFSLIYLIFKMYCILPDWVLQSDIFYIQDVLYSSWLGPSVWFILYSRCIVFFLIGSFSLIYFIFKMYCTLPDWVLQSDIFYIQDVLYSSWLGPSVWYILYSRCIVFFLIGSLQSDIFYIQDVLYSSWLGPYNTSWISNISDWRTQSGRIQYILNIKYIRLKDPIRKNTIHLEYKIYQTEGPNQEESVWYILYSRCIVFFLIGSFSLIYFIFKMNCILPDWVLQSDIFYIQDVLYSSWLGPSVWYILYWRCIVFFLIGSFSLIYFIFKMYCILPDWFLQSDIFYIQDVLYSSWLGPSVWYILYSRCIVFFLIGSFSLINFIFKMYCILPDWVLQSDIFYIQDVLYSSW